MTGVGMAGPVPVTPPGNPVEAWAGVRAFADDVDLREVAARASKLADNLPRLIVISAHPDDETIGAGHLIAQWTRHHGSAIAVTLTGGEAALKGTGVDVRFLADRRIAEWRTATAALGVERHVVWHIPQCEVEGHEDAAVAKLQSLLQDGDVIAAPWRHEPDPDHRAAGRIAARAVGPCQGELLEYLIWAPYHLPPEALAEQGYQLGRVITGDTAASRRKEALKHYTSQLAPLKTKLEAVVPPELCAHHADQYVAIPIAD